MNYFNIWIVGWIIWSVAAWFGSVKYAKGFRKEIQVVQGTMFWIFMGFMLGSCWFVVTPLLSLYCLVYILMKKSLED